MNSKIQLQHVEYMPKELKPGILYVSMRFNVAGHLCPCGCANKVITPLGPYEWKFTEKNGKPTLSPSLGNWQIPWQSHYWITNGEIEWSYQWTKEQIEAGYTKEQVQRELYYRQRTVPQKITLWEQITSWLQENVIRKIFHK